MKTSTLLVLAGAAVILFEMQRQAQVAQSGGYTPPSSGGGLLSGIGSGLSSLFGNLFGGGSSGGSSVYTSNYGGWYGATGSW